MDVRACEEIVSAPGAMSPPSRYRPLRKAYSMTTDTPGYPPMNPDVKAEWLRRLRSGDLVQTTGALHRVVNVDKPGAKHSYCCLGVLSEMAREKMVCFATPGKWTYRLGTMSMSIGYTSGIPRANPYCMPPYEVTLWAGLRTDVMEMLSIMNDGDKVIPKPRHSFEEIADWIEENL